MTSRLRRALCLLLPAGLATRVNAANMSVPEVGQPAPDFELPDQQGKLRRLNEWRGKWLVIYFYPKNDTPGCTEEACHFRDEWLALQALDAQVLGISVDSSSSHKAFTEKYKLPFPLLADAGGAVAARYGALSDWLVIKLAKRYSFVVSPEGHIAKVYRSVDTARHAAEILSDLKQLQQGTRRP